MNIGRNDVCPCGSGKKYKKCCMKKANVVEVGQVKQEQFFRMKHQLVDRLYQELMSSLAFWEYQSLEKEFERRAKIEIPEFFFQHWFFFFHYDKKGLRGIERYNQTVGKRDELRLRQMASKWEKLVPRLIQQVDYDENGVIVEDLFTKEQFHMPYCETMQRWIPWGGTFCLLEEFNGGYYMNGVATIVSPDHLMQAYHFLDNRIKETGHSYDQEVMKLYPEVLSQLLATSSVEKESKELTQTYLYYEIEDLEAVGVQVQKNNHFHIEEWDGDSGKGSFIGAKYQYEDNAVDDSIQLAEIEATLEINHNKMMYSSRNVDDVAAFKEVMKQVKGARLVEEKVETITVSKHLQIKLFSAHLSKDVPPYLSLIAQQTLMLDEVIGQPLALFEGKIPLEMVAHGETAQLEQWLQQQEFASFQTITGTDPGRVTTDFNRIRRKLGLKMSPFVTLREERQSSILKVNPSFNQTSFTEEDRALIAEMDIPLENLEPFYIRDFLEFFKEKGVGRARNTYYKYRLGLRTIATFLGKISVSSWSELSEEHWKELIAHEYLTYHDITTENQVKGFFTVVKSFATKLDKTYGTAYAPLVRVLVKELEGSILKVVSSSR